MSMVPGDVEREISASLASGALEQAAVSTLRAYSDELLGYLIGLLHDPEQAREVFAMFAEDLWSSLRQLTLRTTMRAYCYALARNTAYRFLDRDVRRQRRGVPLSAADVVSRAVALSRTHTPAFLLSETKQQVALLRERLTREEQELLTLRVDRGLHWREVAEALGSDEPDLTTAVARHRKRFQLVKQKLARWAREEGILPTKEDS